MNEETQKLIGTILDPNSINYHVGKRDAVHMAVIVLVAGEDLWAGHQVGLAYGTKTVALRRNKCYGNKSVGIVDPFIGEQVKKGQAFLCWLFPNTVTGMTHQWEHPTFDEELDEPANDNELWLRHFADQWNFDYSDMIQEALSQEGIAVARGIDLHSASQLDAGDENLFWQHLEQLTGQQFNEDHRKNFAWSCSC